MLWRGASDERQPFRCETSRCRRRLDSREGLWRWAAPLAAGPPRRSRAAPVDLTAIGEPGVDEPADSEDDEPVAPEELDACDGALCPNEPAIPRAAGRFGCEPRPTDGTLVGEVAPDTDGVDTVGVWIAGVCTGVVTCGAAGGVTVTGGAFGTVTGGTVTVGTVAVGTVAVGTVAVGTEGTVGVVKAGLA